MLTSGQESYHFASKNGGGGTPAVDGLGLEGVTQRELNQPRGPHGRENLSEWPIRSGIPGTVVGNGFHVVDRRIREVDVIPDVKEVSGEPQALSLGDLDILDQREVPVLLERATVDVAAQIPEGGGAGKGRVGQAAGRVGYRRGCKVSELGITVQPGMNVTGRRSATEGSSRGELRTERRRSETGSEIGRAGDRVGDRERSA